MFTDIAEQYDMLPAGSRVLVAVSGGADSVYLLHRLSEAAGYGAEPPSTPLWSLGVAHFNHRLRGAESARDAAFAENLAASLGLPFYLGAADVGACAQGRHMGLEAAARELRYAFLLKTAEENAYDRIATAHTADDNAETVLLNLIRGSGTKGLCGIPPVRGKIVRPILDVTEAEIRAWLDAREVAYVEDSSNNRDDFARNRLRHRVAPVLRELNPQYAAHILRAGALLRADAACLDGLAEAFLRENAEDAGRPEAGPYSASQMAKLPMPVAARVFRIAAGRTLGEKHIQALLALCKSADPHACADLPGLRVFREYDELFFVAPVGAGVPDGSYPPGFSAVELNIGGEIEIPELDLRVRTEKVKFCPQINNSLKIFFFQYEKLCGKLTVRPRAAGDNIHLPGRNGTKSLKKLFSERRLTLAERARVPVLADENGVLGVYGFGSDVSALARPGEAALKVEFL